MAHYYSKEQPSPLKIKKISARLLGNELEFYTGSGVFSKKKIDKGTQILIEKCNIKKDGKVFDFGCGYGAVGIAVAKAFPAAKVFMSDINKRAVKLAKMNVNLNIADNATVFYSDKFEKINEKFDIILLNPPQTAGKDICFQMIEEAKKYLNKNGLLELVARHNKGGKELSKKMHQVFGNVKDIAKKSGYRVYVSEN